MQIKLKKDVLSTLLKWGQGIAEKKGTLPILSHVLIEATGETLRISATDLEIAVVAETKAEIKVGGKIAVNARNLFDIVKEAPEESVSLVKKEDQSVEVVSGKSRFRLVGLNPEEFPSLPTVSSQEEIELESADLEEILGKTFYAASTEETRYTLNGVYLLRVSHGEQSYLRVVATDGHRLSYDERPVQKKWSLEKGIIIPRKGVSEIKNLLTGTEGNLKVSVDDKAILFKRGSVSLLIRLIEGEFPAYEQVIPKKTDKIVSVERGVFVGALRRMSLMTSGIGRGVKFGFSPAFLEMSVSNPDVGDAREEVPIDYKGGTFQIGFNPKYFLDVLSTLEDEKIVLELKDEVSPCVIRSEFDRGFLALIMPMRI